MGASQVAGSWVFFLLYTVAITSVFSGTSSIFFMSEATIHLAHILNEIICGTVSDYGMKVISNYGMKVTDKYFRYQQLP